MIHFHLLLLIFISWLAPSQALVLEELLQNNTLDKTLENKRVGYFVGSFDPLHKAHEQMVQRALDDGLLDYVLIYPAWGGDTYKVRADVRIRLDMLFSAFQDHPHVIVTRLTPKALQEAMKCNSHFIGLLGSDTALYLAPNPETSIYYMTGCPISEEYAEHTWGSCMAIRVDSFIVTLREGDDITPLQGMIRERPIIATFDNVDMRKISCTALKKALKNNEPIDHFVNPAVAHIIEKHGLYTSPHKAF